MCCVFSTCWNYTFELEFWNLVMNGLWLLLRIYSGKLDHPRISWVEHQTADNLKGWVGEMEMVFINYCGQCCHHLETNWDKFDRWTPLYKWLIPEIDSAFSFCPLSVIYVLMFIELGKWWTNLCYYFSFFLNQLLCGMSRCLLNVLVLRTRTIVLLVNFSGDSDFFRRRWENRYICWCSWGIGRSWQ